MCLPSGIGDIRVKRASATAGNCNFAQGLDVGTAKGVLWYWVLDFTRGCVSCAPGLCD